MNVRVLIGPAGAGKTQACLAALRQAETTGAAAVLLVPDQFTYAADRLLLDDGALPGVRAVQVLSFRRLAHQVGESGLVPTLSEAHRRMLLRRLIHDTPRADWGSWASITETPGFTQALAEVLKDARALAGRDAARRMAAAAGKEAMLGRLAHLAARYDDALGELALTDPEERLHGVAAALRADGGDWRGREFWIDGFAGFTPGEKLITAALIEIAGRLTITLCCDPEDAALALTEADQAAARGVPPTGDEFFARLRPRLVRPALLPTLRTLVWLNELSGGGLDVEDLSAPPPRFAARPNLARLADQLFSNRRPTAPRHEPDGAVMLLGAAHPYHEVQAWARLIDGWARLDESPIRYREVAVLVRDLDTYQPLVEEAFRGFQIPYFIDQRRDVMSDPLMRLALAALNLAARGWSRPAVIGVLRNPLLGLGAEAVDRLENLALEYGIEYERWWEASWELLPAPSRMRFRRSESTDSTDEDGPDDDIDPADEDAAETSTPERMRFLLAREAREITARTFPTLRAFCDVWRTGETDFSAGAGALRHLLAACRPAGGGTDPQIEALLEEVLEGGVRLMGGVPLSAGDFVRLLRDALSGATLGATPRSLDAVVVTEPRRARVNEIRRMILGGLDAESFPRAASPDPLLSDDERARLAACGLPLATAAARAEEDPYIFYIACTRATEQLVLSYAALAPDGAAREPSPYLLEVERALGHPPQQVAPAQDAAGLQACQHAWELPARMAEALVALDAADSALLSAAARREVAGAEAEIARSETCAERIRDPLPLHISPELLGELYPQGVLTSSASRLDTFARCPFLHFAQRVLHLEPRPQPVLTPRSTGSAAHAALQRFFAAPDLPDSPDGAAGRIRRIFSDLALEEDYRIFQEDPPSAYRWTRTGHALEHFVRAEHRRLEGSDYRPEACELSFGMPGDPSPFGHLPAFEIALDPAAAREAGLPTDRPWRLRLRGQIDRLDVAGSRALIIDYKQGQVRNPSPRDLEQGLGLQVAGYMLAVRELLKLDPVGGLYYSFKPQVHQAHVAVPETNPQRFELRGIHIQTEKEAIDPSQAILKPPHRKSQRLDAAGFEAILGQVRRRIERTALEILQGNIRPLPAQMSGGLPCVYCEFGAVCRFDPRIHPVRGEPLGAQEHEA